MDSIKNNNYNYYLYNILDGLDGGWVFYILVLDIPMDPITSRCLLESYFQG